MSTSKNTALETRGEPLWTTGGFVAAIAAVVTLLVAFGLELSEAQVAAILGVASVIAPVIVAILARNKVVPLENVAALHNKAGDVVSGPASPIHNGTAVEVWRVSSTTQGE